MNSHIAVLFGAGGQLGAELKRVFSQRGYDVRGFERSQLDISDAAAVEQCLTGIDPALVLNSAAYNKVDLAENEPLEAYKANALAVANLAKTCRQIDARLVHFSTDYVFDGMAGRAYVESDAPHPLGAYAVSKLGGELYAQAYLDQPLVIRVSGVFGPAGVRTAHGNFIETMLRLAKSGNPIRVVEDFVASPTYTLALAERTADLVERKAHGVYHVGGGRPISWYDFANLIFEAAGLKPELQATNERTYRTPARRPKYSALRNARLEAEEYPGMPRLEVAIEEYLKLSAAMRPS
jgi:dTDP-4-dehydrorhamnose reductase